MNLFINNKIITGDLKVILNKLAIDSHKNYFKKIIDNGDNLTVTCPIHKNGNEGHPSCNIYQNKEGDIEFGKVHCFTCGYTATLPQLVAYCLGVSVEVGSKWLVDNFGGDNSSTSFLPEISLEKPQKMYLNESILDQYDYYHPYMWKRHLTKEVVDRFRVGFDKKSNCITFPVWDEKGNLVMVTKRNVDTKQFYIEADKEKPVYLLNYIIRNNITTVYVCESQINALTLWSWGYPAIALFGTGSSGQLDILKKSGIRHYILCLDGDNAGDKGTERFIKNIPSSSLLSIKKMPRDGRDVNDLTKEEFDNLEVTYG